MEEIKEFQPKTEIPEDLTIEKAKEIRKNVQSETQKVMTQLQMQGLPPNEFQEKFMKEIARLDDMVYIKYGFKNNEVLEAFQKYKLIPTRSAMTT